MLSHCQRFCTLFFLILCVSCAYAGNPPVTIDAPVIGETAPQTPAPTDVPRYTPIAGIAGDFLYTYNTAVYGPNGLSRSWENYLVLTRISDAAANDTADKPVVEPSSYQVHLPRDMMMRQPHFSQDGAWIAIKIGETANPTYRLYLMNVPSRDIIEAGNGEGDQPVVWSPNSRYLVYYNGDYTAHERYWPLKIMLFDRKMGKSVTVATEYDLEYRVSWTPDNHLLFSIKPDAWDEKRKATRMPPGLYSYTPGAGGKPIRIIANATQPVPSPDGRWIAACQTRGTRDGEEQPYERTLALYSRKGDKPVLLPAHDHGDAMQYFWSPNSQQIYYLIRKNDNADTETKPNTFSLYQYTLATSKTHHIATINGSYLTPFGVSQTGSYFVYSIMQSNIEGLKRETPQDSIIVQALDLTTGKPATLIKANGWWNGVFDWRERQVNIGGLPATNSRPNR